MLMLLKHTDCADCIKPKCFKAALTTLRGTSSKNTGNNCHHQRLTILFLTRSLIEDNRWQRGPSRGSPRRAFPTDGEKFSVSIICCETMSSCQLRGRYWPPDPDRWPLCGRQRGWAKQISLCPSINDPNVGEKAKAYPVKSYYATLCRNLSAEGLLSCADLSAHSSPRFRCAAADSTQSNLQQYIEGTSWTTVRTVMLRVTVHVTLTLRCKKTTLCKQ